LDLSGLPSKEYAPVKQIIFQRQTSYDDNGNCRIEDVRNVVGGFASSQTQSAPSVHNNTTDRDAADAHPISSITNLQTALDAKVVGIVSATDNAIARFDSTTGKLIQNSTCYN
jgi:hypothetical protein